MSWKFTMLAVFAWFAATQAHGQTDVLAALQARDFATLEREFGAVEKRFEKGNGDEYELLDAFKPLYMREDRFSDELAAWVQMYPKSYVAHVARGTYYRKLGELNRGTGTAAEVPGSSMSYMDRMFDLSEKDLAESLPLTRKPYLALLNLMNIARYRSDAAAADRYLARGNALLPSNMLLRGRYQDHLKPRWGGSYERMDAFVARAKKERIEQANVGLLAAMIVEDKALAADLSGDLRSAMDQYKEALGIARGASRRLQEDYLPAAVGACKKGLLEGYPCP